MEDIKTSWDIVELSRQQDRMTGHELIDLIFEDFIEFHGDRSIGDDKAIVGGIASLKGKPVTVIGVQKGKNLSDNIETNFGQPSPEGYRKALRLMKQAEKFNRPIICFVNTPGAYSGATAEERGQGSAIATNLLEMSGLSVPVISILTGEGGSGGALALSVANEVWIMENATYSILSPEGFATILWKDGSKAKEASELMKMTAKDLLENKIVDKIILEYNGEKKLTNEEIANNLQEELEKALDRYSLMSKEDIKLNREIRFRKY
jgi:acetyl-CoA carboxylase carboxyl transferase subunit alpha